ncbi:MAG: SPOR domain-containing protein [Candidatus Caenarcaniphilales bacterium]|jgi:cell division protein FtsN|nr:SPOR domain-containing protein [Candidatus Caenarcaniphilales bacterium]
MSQSDNYATLEELNRLKLANTIINRGVSKIGVRPLYIGKIQQFTSPETKQKIEKIREIADKLREEKSKLEIQKPILKTKEQAKRKLNPRAKIVYLVLIFLVSSFAVYQLFFAKPKTVLPAEEQQSQGSIVRSASTDSVTKNFFISSGSYQSEAGAQAAFKELTEMLGVELAVVQMGQTWTVRIGPEYGSQEDAMTVLDELARYGIMDLAIHANYS